MPFCRTCQTQKPVYEFQEGSAGESEICIPCAHDAGERLRALAALPSAGEERRFESARRVLRLPTTARKHPGPLTPAPAKRALKQSHAAPAPRPAQQAQHQPMPDLAALRAEIEREVRAKLEAEFKPKHPPASQAIGFRIVTFDDQDTPLRFGQLRAALDEVAALFEQHGLPSLDARWYAWNNGAWLKAASPLAERITGCLSVADIEGLEVFEGYPEDFFLNAVPV